MMDKIQKLKSFKFPILFQLQCFHFRFLCVVKKYPFLYYGIFWILPLMPCKTHVSSLFPIYPKTFHAFGYDSGLWLVCNNGGSMRAFCTRTTMEIVW